MPRKATTPKPITFALTSDKTGVTLKVGNSPTTAATLYPRHVTELANLLGMNREGVVEKSLRAQLRSACLELETARKERDMAHASRVEAVNLRDAAVRVAKTWEDAAARNLDDLNATKRELTTLQANFDALNDEFKAARQELRDIEKLRSEALLQRDATILGWRLATVAVVFVAIALAIWKGGAR